MAKAIFMWVFVLANECYFSPIWTIKFIKNSSKIVFYSHFPKFNVAVEHILSISEVSQKNIVKVQTVTSRYIF